MKKLLREFDNRFKYFKDVFPYLSYPEKARGLESFDLLIVHLWTVVEVLWINSGRTNEWRKLVDEVRAKTSPIYELMYSLPLEESLELRRHLIGSKIEFIDDIFNQQEFHLSEIHRSYQKNNNKEDPHK